MLFRHDLLDSVADNNEAPPTFGADLNVHGMYETMRFVLRLSSRNHELIEHITDKGMPFANVTPEIIQAFSTYIHETVHWWQHVGSTSGLLFSLSYLAQCHSSLGELREVIATIGPKKPLKGYTDQVLRAEGNSAQAKLASANIAVNNALDVEYYKSYAYSPRKNIEWMRTKPHFESVGHGYYVVYSQLVGMISEAIDPDCVILPDAEQWNLPILRLSQEKVDGYYWGSPVHLPAVGLQAVYEGQARFTQLQFLSGTLEEPISLTQYRADGLLFGIYVEAFEAFLRLSESDWPTTIDDPLVALFLLVCDLAINPTRGLPIDIEGYARFIDDVDVGVRFTVLSRGVAELPHLKQAIIAYSREEYFTVSEELTSLVGYDHPIVGPNAILQWIEHAPGLPKLMQEYEDFDFGLENLSIRVFLSHFVALYRDKASRPEFFCWPGVFLSGEHGTPETQALWLRHLSLFSDRGDRQGVYPRRWPNRSEASVMKTFNQFFGTMALYDLTRQWLLADGPFLFDFEWLSATYDAVRAKTWGDDTFRQVYGITLDQFEIVQ